MHLCRVGLVLFVDFFWKIVSCFYHTSMIMNYYEVLLRDVGGNSKVYVAGHQNMCPKATLPSPYLSPLSFIDLTYPFLFAERTQMLQAEGISRGARRGQTQAWQCALFVPSLSACCADALVCCVGAVRGPSCDHCYSSARSDSAEEVECIHTRSYQMG